MKKRVTVLKPLSAARIEQIGRMFHNVTRINEAFLGYLADQATVDVRVAYDRYEDVCAKYGDDMWMAFPTFIDHVNGLQYVKVLNDRQDGRLDLLFVLQKIAA